MLDFSPLLSKGNKSMNKYNLTKELLETKYRNEQKSTYQIGKELNICKSTILYNFKKFNIEIRSKKEVNKLRHKSKYNLSKKFLIDEYWKQEKSVTEIAKELNMPTQTLHYHFKYNFKIPYRTKKERILLSLNKNISKETLNQKYIIEKQSAKQISLEFGTSISSIYKKLKKHKIPRRDNQSFNPKSFSFKKEFIIDEYFNKKKSISEMAKENNVSTTVLRNYCKRNSIKLRSNAKSHSIDNDNKITKKILKQKYLLEKKKVDEIAIELNTNRMNIYRRLKRYNIKTRTQSDYGIWCEGLTKETDTRIKILAEKTGKKAKERLKDKENNPFYGKHHTKESLEKQKKSHKITLQKLKDKYGRCASPETSRKISLATKGKNNPMYGKVAKGSGGSKRGKYNGTWMRSGWERKYAKYLDENNVNWNYEPKTFDLGNTTYTPDFYLPDTNEWIEIKGWWRPEAIEKFSLFQQKYPSINIEVLQRKELENLGIKL